jgi:hypothetical protein
LGYVAKINLSYGGPLAQFTTGFSSAINPSAIGQTLQTQSVFVNYTYRLTQHLMLDLTTNATRSQSIGGQSASNSTSQFNRTYFTASPGITWEVEKNWRLRGSYVYGRQDFQQDINVQNLNAGTSEVNLVMLSLNYSWDGIRKSR